MGFEEVLGEIINSFSNKTLTLKGDRKIDIASLISVASGNASVKLSLSQKRLKIFDDVVNNMMSQVENGVAMYGTTTSYGGRAGVVLNKGDVKKRIENATKLSESIIHVDVSTGDPIPRDIVRAAMLVRVNMLLSGASAIRIETLKTFLKLISEDVTPIVGRYGSLGASGDLAQNGRVLSCLLQNPNVKVWDKKGNVTEARKLLKALGIKPLRLAPNRKDVLNFRAIILR